MAKGAPKGNQNAKKGTEWRDAINKALKTYAKNDVERGHALRRIAEKLVQDAIAGDPAARKEIGERLDGKPVTPISGEDGGPLTVQILRFGDSTATCE